MAVVISAMAPNCTPSLHGSSRLSRASMPPSPPSPPALAQKAVQDTLFTDEEFQALMSGQCELLSFSSENHLQQPSSPLLFLQMQAQLLCRDDDADDAARRFQEKPPSFTLVDDLEEPISDEDIELLAPMFCDEEIEALCATPQASVHYFSWPRPDDDHQTGKNRMPSPPWPSCIAEDDEDQEAGPPPSPPPPPIKKARTETMSRSIRPEHEPPLPRPPCFPPPIKKARTQTKRRSRPEHVAAREDRLRRHLHKWQNTIATRILAREFRPFRAPELSRGRTALRCQCPELALALAGGGGRRAFSCCALHQDAPREHKAWMSHWAQGHAPPLVGGPGEVLVPAASAGSSRAMVRQYVRWRRSVSMPSRFYVQRVLEKGLAVAAQLPDDDWTMPESPKGLPDDDDWMMPDYGSLGL